MTNENLTALVAIESRPALLEVNFEQLQQALTARLEQYETVVSEDGVKDAKSSATDINKLKGELAKRRKDAVREASAPVREFEDRMKALEGQCEEARRTILDQVERYETKRRETAQALLDAARDQYWRQLGVRDEFKRAECDDLIKISSLTAKDNLAKAAEDEVQRRCQADKSVQDMVDRRLLELENRSYRAGLSAPLTRDHIHQWLNADDETYEAQLQRILDAEVTRQEQAEQRMREKVEREQRQQAERDAAEQARRERQQNDTPRAEPQSAPSPVQSAPASDETPSRSASGRVQVEITCRFVTEIPEHISDERLESELRKKLTAAGLNSLDSVAIARRAKAA